MSATLAATPEPFAVQNTLPSGGLRFCLRHPQTLPQWFLSRRYRHAVELRKHVWKLRHAQSDILKPTALAGVDAAIRDFDSLLKSRPDRARLEQGTKSLEEAANKWLIPYPNPRLRENVEVFLVAIGVAMAIRTFFLQPFKIPTGSMQPTLFGLHFEDLRGRPDGAVPGPIGRIAAAVFKGDIYHELTAKADGEVVGIKPRRPLLFISRQDIVLRYREGGRTWEETETIWFSPVDGNGGDLYRGLISGVVGWSEPRPFHPLLPGQPFKKGEVILRMKDSTGDHLFVDRVTYNFRPPKRGEIIVFETDGIQGLVPGQFYIKRLVGLGGERLRLGDDRHLVVDGRRLDASDRHFERVYSFEGPPADSRFSGHVNGTVGRQFRPGAELAPLFPNETAEVSIPPGRFMVMGDNTMNSLDSRAWGDFDREKVIGRYCFVWWPFTSRWGTRPN